MTGAGGGYNEREGVEYNEREDSDEEFDEVLYSGKFYEVVNFRCFCESRLFHKNFKLKIKSARPANCTARQPTKIRTRNASNSHI